jgi:TonB family protein
LLILPGPIFDVPDRNESEDPMRLGLQTIRKSEPSEAPETDQGSDEPSEALRTSQPTGPSEPESEQSSSDESEAEPEEQPSESSPGSDEKAEQTRETERPKESSEELSRPPSNQENEPTPEESGDEPVFPPSDQETDKTSDHGGKSESRDDPTTDLLKKKTSFSSDIPEGWEQNSGGEASARERTSVGEDFRRYRAVETVESSDTQSMKIVLSDTGTGSEGETTSVEVPSITVDREAPDRETVEEESPASGPVAPWQSSVDREVIEQPLPEVPEWLERTGQDVRIILQYDINREGNLMDIVILTSSGYPELDDRSVDRLSEWKYEPGPPVRDALTVFEFRLE